MQRFKLLSVAVAACAAVQVYGQTNLQLFYDFGSDRRQVTATVEMFKNDRWGNTFFFIDHDFRTRREDGPSLSGGNEAPYGTYFELARAINLWQDTRLAPLSLHVEYNGGVYDNYYINNAWLVGIDYFIHSANFNNTLTLQVLYKSIAKTHSKLPMQFTAVWGMDRLMGVKGLRFAGFADLWWQDHVAFPHADYSRPVSKSVTFVTEPQLWYNIGRHFGCDNLNLGTEIEMSVDFGTYDGFRCNPCLGMKWDF